MTWLTPPDRLTAAQAAAIKAPTTVPVVLRGGPGAGKTVVLLQYFRHAIKSLKKSKLFLIYHSACFLR